MSREHITKECPNYATKKEWQRWCRLCGKYDGHYFDIFIEGLQPTSSQQHLDDVINKFFHIQIKPSDELPVLLCAECYTFINYLKNFADHVSKVQAMYQELLDSANTTITDIKYIYEKYGIFKLEPYVQHTLAETVNHIAPTAIEQIFVTDVPVLKIKDEEVEETPAIVKNLEAEIKVEFEDPFARNASRNVQAHAETSEDSDSSASNSHTFSSDTEYRVAEKKTVHMQRTNPKVSSNSTTAYDNDQNEGSYVCDICNQRFVQYRNYVWHMKNKHGTETPHQCKSCSSFFKYKKELQRHFRKMHAPKIYPCPHCERKFKRAKDAENHIKAEHEGEGSLICEECGESVRTKEKLLEHMAIHTGRGAFECKECGKCFARKFYLKRHAEIHGDKHVCGECGLELTTSKALKLHSRVHSNEMPYKCDYCGRRFKRTKNLKGHLITHTGLKPFSCDFCDKTFSTGSSCRYHKKHLHPKELAELEAAGVKAYTKNIPKIEVLKAITQATGKVKEAGDFSISDKRIKLPKLDAHLIDQ
ncbi:zinc finger protein OZF-like [Bactrocera tryoni]|uniref:zinc finger protein OZF-like n=1 Tax=Bactrocera tryoni TaxID=59916 RepID=UPI001A973CAC|nr:zinc finger protein OZF-like [Bactrocera tryoni]